MAQIFSGIHRNQYPSMPFVAKRWIEAGPVGMRCWAYAVGAVRVRVPA